VEPRPAQKLDVFATILLRARWPRPDADAAPASDQGTGSGAAPTTDAKSAGRTRLTPISELVEKLVAIDRRTRDSDREADLYVLRPGRHVEGEQCLVKCGWVRIRGIATLIGHFDVAVSLCARSIRVLEDFVYHALRLHLETAEYIEETQTIVGTLRHPEPPET
jgi:hypothetical protein